MNRTSQLALWPAPSDLAEVCKRRGAAPRPHSRELHRNRAPRTLPAVFRGDLSNVAPSNELYPWPSRQLYQEPSLVDALTPLCIPTIGVFRGPRLDGRHGLRRPVAGRRVDHEPQLLPLRPPLAAADARLGEHLRRSFGRRLERGLASCERAAAVAPAVGRVTWIVRRHDSSRSEGESVGVSAKSSFRPSAGPRSLCCGWP